MSGREAGDTASMFLMSAVKRCDPLDGNVKSPFRTCFKYTSCLITTMNQVTHNTSKAVRKHPVNGKGAAYLQLAVALERQLLEAKIKQQYA